MGIYSALIPLKRRLKVEILHSAQPEPPCYHTTEAGGLSPLTSFAAAPAMSLSFIEGRTHLEFVCGGAMDIGWLVHWLENESEDIRSITRHLVITDEDVQALPASVVEVSLCALHEIVSLLPNLQGLYLTGLVVVRGDYNHGDNIPALPSQQLRVISLKRIATIYPFEIDPLQIIELAPRLRELSLEGCYALRTAPDTHPDLINRRIPHLQLGPPCLFPPTFASLRVVFPDRNERDHYSMRPEWYEFMTRLPFAKGTRSMVLENVYDGIAAAMAAVIDYDAETLTSLTVEFLPRFQCAWRLKSMRVIADGLFSV